LTTAMKTDIKNLSIVNTLGGGVSVAGVFEELLGIAISVTCARTGTAFTEFTTIMHTIGPIGMECPAHTVYCILWVAPDQNDKFRFYPIFLASSHLGLPP